MSKIEKAFYATSIILLFQVFKNLNLFVYAGVLFLSYLILYTYLFFNKRHINKSNCNKQIDLVALLFFLSLLWIPFISLIHIELEKLVISIPRYLITLPYIFFYLNYRRFSKNLIINILKAICLFMMIASLSIPYQIIFGEISFLADSSIRAGLVRYSSLAGSLTALGTLGGFSLTILLFCGNILFKKKVKIVIMVITILGMLMSMQKSAIANIILCFFFYIVFNNKIKLNKRIFTIFGAFAFILILYYLFRNTSLGVYIESNIQYSINNNDSSTNIMSDLFNRLWYYPSKVIEINNIKSYEYIFGIGLGALSGTMGLPELPMAHNNYFDLILSGGIIHFILYLIILIRIPIKVVKKRFKKIPTNHIETAYAVLILLVLVNMMIGAATFYQPIATVIIFFTTFSYNAVAKYEFKCCTGKVHFLDKGIKNEK